jgi:hypothetical protein
VCAGLQELVLEHVEVVKPPFVGEVGVDKVERQLVVFLADGLAKWVGTCVLDVTGA